MKSFLFWVASLFTAGTTPVEALPLETLRTMDGVGISVWASEIRHARQMAWSPKGIVYVGSMTAGDVHAVVDRDGDGEPERTVRVASGFRMPSGVAWRDGSLWIADIGRIWKLENVDALLDDLPEPRLVTDALPDDTHHGWKHIEFGPDGRLWVPVGAPCNVCRVEDPHGTILSMNPDGTDVRVEARGVRNSVGFDWHPKTGELWFSDNGRDRMGDDVPPEEINRVREAGLHFGFPFCHAEEIVDPKHGGDGECAGSEPPAWTMGAHVAPLGVEFYEGEALPLSGSLVVAQHGSWNRSVPDGYRVVAVDFDESGKPSGSRVVVEGWLGDDGEAWGRPVDVLELPDGSVLVSDDRAGVIYRLVAPANDGVQPPSGSGSRLPPG